MGKWWLNNSWIIANSIHRLSININSICLFSTLKVKETIGNLYNKAKNTMLPVCTAYWPTLIRINYTLSYKITTIMHAECNDFKFNK